MPSMIRSRMFRNVDFRAWLKIAATIEQAQTLLKCVLGQRVTLHKIAVRRN